MKISIKVILLTAIPVLVIGFSGCTTMSGTAISPPAERPALFGPRSLPKERGTASGVRAKLVQGAYKIVGARNLIIRGRRFNFDCTGTVLAIYYYAGIDLSREFSKYSGNGVLRLYKIMKVNNLLYITKYPVPGDLIFWDNTYDRNRDGKMNDYLTHVGMVVRVYNDGTIEYIHEHIRKGITIEKMNLRNPDTYSKKVMGKTIVVNAPMRMKTAGVAHPSAWLASQLLRDFGKGYLLYRN